ncbi:hypothetical protein Pa4123_49790 [Phytohabitans aurantiacus]|uniref:Uncharacterized protein n=1 Tax=Phytohabitans aurantiacus TaxID=3016789 RepID=A0ABQ5QYS4_9ACTN|nr:hypothetical protein Pa4123_49790 [Phytohabitans aurantiacus]
MGAGQRGKQVRVADQVDIAEEVGSHVTVGGIAHLLGQLRLVEQ